MGIRNLLEYIKPLFKKRNISDFEGKRLGIDGHVWLHKSIYGNNLKMAFDENEDSYLIYLKSKVEKLLNMNIIPIFVFDGDSLPLKKKTEESREKSREAKIIKAYEYLSKGDTLKAKLEYIRAIDITSKMVYEFTLILDKLNVNYYVAPYEADAQLAWMISHDLVDVVCTEDSDLIAYGCKRLIYKLDLNKWSCQYLIYKDIIKNELSSFKGWDRDMFLNFCILSGCDYFKLDGISSKTAYKLILKYKDPQYIKSKKIKSMDFLESFKKAKNAFTNHVIYCIFSNKQRSLNPVNEEIPSYLGVVETDEIITYLLSKSYINPINYTSF